MADITVTIPVELTQAMIIRSGVIKDEARALELAIELHDVVAACVKLFLAKSKPSPLELADFALAVWRQALVSQDGTSDGEEGAWTSEILGSICDDDLYLRWIMLGDVVTGSDVATILMEGGVH
jgi:hypothetical protein